MSLVKNAWRSRFGNSTWRTADSSPLRIILRVIFKFHVAISPCYLNSKLWMLLSIVSMKLLDQQNQVVGLYFGFRLWEIMPTKYLLDSYSQLLEMQGVASPADLIKVRMQADGRLLSQGLQPRYAGIFDALKKIIQIEGFWGLWRGVFPNAQRAFLVNMGELACYDNAKRFIVNKEICGDNIYAHSLASVASGLSATALSCPADVIKTRMMNQAAGKGTKIIYRNSCDCLVKTVKYEGLMALWKGFFPTWARLGPWQFVFWVSYEEFRYAVGLSSF